MNTICLVVSCLAVLPPAPYDEPPSGQVIVMQTSGQAEMRSLCKIPMTSPNPIQACARWTRGSGGMCVIWIDHAEIKRDGRIAYNDIIRHEVGHCMGWPGTHPRPDFYIPFTQPKPNTDWPRPTS